MATNKIGITVRQKSVINISKKNYLEKQYFTSVMTDDVTCPKNGCAHKKSMYMYAQRVLKSTKSSTKILN